MPKHWEDCEKPARDYLGRLLRDEHVRQLGVVKGRLPGQRINAGALATIDAIEALMQLAGLPIDEKK